VKKLFLLFLFVLLVSSSHELFYPAEARAQEGLVPCGNLGQPACNLCHGLEISNRIVTFFLAPSVYNGGFALVPLLGVLFLAVGGFLLLIGGLGNPRIFSRGRTIIFAVIIGLLIVYGAWVAVNTIFTLFGATSFNGTGQWWQITCEYR
jgi:hypothetical protein